MIELGCRTWENLTTLEQRRVEVSGAGKLWADLLSARSTAVRLLFMFYERDRWHADSRAGSELLRGCSRRARTTSLWITSTTRFAAMLAGIPIRFNESTPSKL